MSDQIKNCSEPIDAVILSLENSARALMSAANIENRIIAEPAILAIVERLNKLHDHRESLLEEIRKHCKLLSRHAQRQREHFEEIMVELEPLKLDRERLINEVEGKDALIVHYKKIINELGGKI